MTAEQLQHARDAAWRHDGHALLTGEDAAAWLRLAGLALFLPRPAQIAAPVGSFVEATLGEANPTPALHAIEAAAGLLRGMLASASGAADAVALNLLGAPGDQPDFLATEETLPFVFALRGDREWRRGPRGKSSPLVTEVWKLLDRDGAQSADEIKDKLGRHLTESAALRALTELWTTLRVEPIYTPDGAAEQGAGTHWQLLEANHERAMTAGSAMAQGMALSALVSVYLQSAVAATGDEIEAFLSPLASRSRVRDAVRGLHATRQLSVQHLGANEHFFVEGSLPEFGEALPRELPKMLPRTLPKTLQDMLPETPGAFAVVADAGNERPAGEAAGGLQIDALSDAETERERAVGDGRKRFVAGRPGSAGDRRGFAPARAGAERTGGPRKSFGEKTFRGTTSGASSFGGRSDGARQSFGAPNDSFGKRSPFRPGNEAGNGAGAGTHPGKPDGATRPFFAREPWKEDRRSADANRQGGPGTDRGASRPERSVSPSEQDDSRSGRPAAFTRGERKPPFAGSFRNEANRKSFPPRGAGPNRTGQGGADGGTRPPRKTFVPRDGDDRPARTSSAPRGVPDRPSTPRESARPAAPGDRKPFTAGIAPRSDSGSAPRSSRPGAPGRDRKPFAARSGDRPGARDGRAPFAPREGGESAAPRGDRRPFSPREGSRPSPPGADRKPFAPRGDRKSFAPREDKAGERKPFAARDGKPYAPREPGAPGRRTFGPRAGAPDGVGQRRGFAPQDRAGAPGQNGRRQDRTGRSDAESGASPRRFPGGEGRPARPGAPAARPAGKRPRTAPFTSSGKPRPGVSATGRPGPRSGPGAGPRAGRPGKPASGRKPGAPPRKPGAKGPGKGPARGAGPGSRPSPRDDG